MPEELRIILIGKANSGKSSSGNTILGNTIFRRNASVLKCKMGETNNRFGKDLTVIDTPGLFNIRMTNVDALQEVAEGFRMTSPGPHAIVFVLAVGRYTQEDQDTVTLFHEMCGDAMYRHMVVVFTGNDYLEREDTTIEQYVCNENFPFQTLLQNCDNRYIAFDNTPGLPSETRDNQAHNFLAKIEETEGYYAIEERRFFQARQNKGFAIVAWLMLIMYTVISGFCQICFCVWTFIKCIGSFVYKKLKCVLNLIMFWK